MSDDGERACPLCAEEMDLTDQQLKPCKCGYEICIWCWHHMIEMAEKEDTEARCPACRTPYDKDSVLKVAAANSERIITEMYSEKKQRSQRAKPKLSAETMKHLSSVRVMQKNLVYITGLPANLCDESILERKEYFGQYGKVLKVSISRPAGTSSQKTSNNNTFGVYVTYAREEEAVRCIQAVHNFVLEGKSLRACFGTTKYCRAWLKNMTCSNPDCLYLHGIGSQEDSFTKDEIVSAYTRSRVPQIASSNSQRRSGNGLPSPLDDFYSSGTGLDKHSVKSACNNASSQVKGSPPNTISGKPNGLPAAASWGLRSSNCRLSASSVQFSQTAAKQKLDTINNSSLPSLSVASSKQPSGQHDELLTTSKVPESKEAIGAITRPLEPLQLGTSADSPLTLSSGTVLDGNCTLRSSWNDDVSVTSKPQEETKMEDLDDRSGQLEPLRPEIGGPQKIFSSELSTQIVDVTDTYQVYSSCSSSPLDTTLEDKERGIISNGRQFSKSNCDRVTYDTTIFNDDVQSMGSRFSSVNTDENSTENQMNVNQHQTSVSDIWSAEMPRSQNLNSAPVTYSTNEPMDWNTEIQKQQLIYVMNGMEDPLAFQHNRSSPRQNHLHNSTNYSNSTFRSNGLRSEQPQISNSSRAMDRKLEMTICSLGDKESAVQNEHREDDISLYSLSRNNSPGFNCTEEKAKPLGRIDITSSNNKASVDRMGESTEEKTRPLGRIDITSSNNKAGVDKMGESSIISDILSLDFDPWDDSLSSANTLVRLLGEKEEQDRSFTLSNSWKSLTSNQSRFSFARQQSQTSLLESPVREINHAQKFCHSSQDSFQDNFQNVLQFNDSKDPYVITSGNNSSDRTACVPRAKITAPPGFSAPSRARPPGFSGQDRFNQEHETAYSGGNHYQSHLAGNSGDVEFIDPAILAIGKGQIHLGADNSTSGLTTSFPVQFSTSDSDPRLHLMAQQSVSSHQNMRTQDFMGERFLPLNDAHIASQLMAQSHTSISPLAQLSLQQLRNPLFPNNQWNAWNSIRTSNDRVMGEIFRSERFGLTNYYTSNGENKLYIPSAGDLYNRAFGM